MKRITSIIIAVMIMLTALSTVCLPTAFAANYCGENVTWSLTDGVLTISGSGDMTSYSNDDLSDFYSGELVDYTPWHDKRADITEVVVKDGVTSIGCSAFFGCGNLRKVTVASSVTLIDSYAFKKCVKLKTLKLKSGLKEIGSQAFWECTSLTSVVIPNGTETIQESAFYGCSSLKDVTIPDSVTYIKATSFQSTPFINNKSNYENGALYLGKVFMSAPSTASGKFTVKSGTLSIAPNAFSSGKNITEIVLPNSVTVINHYAFAYCEKLTTVVIPEGVSKLEQNLFWQCTSLKNVTIPLSVTTICEGAFSECGIETLNVPDGVKKIERCAFRDCASLKKITGLKNVTFLGDTAFRGCNSLKTLSTFKKLETIEKYAFLDCAALTTVAFSKAPLTIGDLAFKNCKKLTGIVIPEGATSIGKEAFLGCASLTKVVLPSTLKELGDKAFEDCTGMTSLTLSEGITGEGFGSSIFWNCESLKTLVLPSTMTNIPRYCFAYCSALTEVALPASLKTIKERAFSDCEALEKVTMQNQLVSIGTSAFVNCTKLKDVSLPSSLTEIGTGAFANCKGIKSVVIPKGVTFIGDSAFLNCTSLTDIKWNDAIEGIGANALNYTPYLENSIKAAKNEFYVNDNILVRVKTTVSGKYTVKKGTTYICANAFEFATGITEVVLPNTITEICDYTFYNCTGLKKCVIPSSVKTIGHHAFAECISLKKVTVPETVQMVSDGAFDFCDNVTEYTTGQSGLRNRIGIWFPKLKKINLTSDVTDPYSRTHGAVEAGFPNAFLKFNISTNYLEEITVAEENEHFCSENGILYSKDKKSIVVYPNNKAAKAFALPDEITSVEKTAFAYCENLTSLLLNRNVNSLNWEKFSKNIKNVYVRSSAKNNTAFENGKPSDVTVIYLEDKLTDISRDKWYANYVETAYGYQLFNGTSDTKFEPNKTLTRAMFITVLARISGAELDNSAATDFKDVEKGKWYTGAIKWAVTNGVTNGLDAKTFGVNNNITREQMCTMLVRFADCLEITLKSDIEAISFHDDKSISDWAKESVYTCQRAGIINGIETDGKTCFNPRGNATRAEASKITVLFYKDYI